MTSRHNWGQSKLTLDTVQALSKYKQEPKWMLQIREAGFRAFEQAAWPQFGPSLAELKLDQIVAFLPSAKRPKRTWASVPANIKHTFDQLGVPEVEQKYLAGLTAQSESTAIYHQLQTVWQAEGIIFSDIDTALKAYPELIQAYFGQLVPPTDNLFAALNTAFWSGGSFLYVPKHKQLALPVQSYFHFDTQKLGQFERTLIILEPNSRAQYLEGCSAPLYSEASLHAAVVEVFLAPQSSFSYTTVQNWSTNVYNLVTKRAQVKRHASLTWIDCNLGSKITMKYPTALLAGPHASANLLSLALADKDQHQDTGARAIHLAPHTKSLIRAYSLSIHGGNNTFRGTVKITPQAKQSQSKLNCDTLILDSHSEALNYPSLNLQAPGATATQEAVISKIEAKQLLYMQSRGLSESQALSLLVNGFFDPVLQSIPSEYSLEINRLLEMITHD